MRSYKGSAMPAKGWVVEEGVLKSAKGGGGGDLVSVDEYGDFELTFEFRLTEKANSGVMYRVQETLDATWQTGPEFQVLDDAGHGLKPDNAHSCGALYDLAGPAARDAAGAPTAKAMKPTGEWNTGRIYLRNGVVQHWLNGVKVVEVPVEGAAWAERIGKSKFKGYARFGTSAKGRVAIQDHGDEVWYRNIKVRDLGAPLPGEVTLFGGADPAGAAVVFPPPAKDAPAVWSSKDGSMVCAGTPAGYIRTKETYGDFVLKVQWRFSPVTKQGGNSGVLVRVRGEDRVWPTSVEAQLQSGSAGDFWNIGGVAMTTDPARTNGRNTRRTHTAERPVGEWNEYEIIADGGTVVLRVNGEELNRATGVDTTPGFIALQSEGVEIHFRGVRLSPLK
jgi:hypothetical protein